MDGQSNSFTWTTLSAVFLHGPLDNLYICPAIYMAWLTKHCDISIWKHHFSACMSTPFKLIRKYRIIETQIKHHSIVFHARVQNLQQFVASVGATNSFCLQSLSWGDMNNLESSISRIDIYETFQNPKTYGKYICFFTLRSRLGAFVDTNTYNLTSVKAYTYGNLLCMGKIYENIMPAPWIHTAARTTWRRCKVGGACVYMCK